MACGFLFSFLFWSLHKLYKNDRLGYNKHITDIYTQQIHTWKGEIPFAFGEDREREQEPGPEHAFELLIAGKTEE